MPLVRLASETDFEGWRIAARSLLMQDIAPEEIEWRVNDNSPSLFDTPEFVPAQVQSLQIKVSRDFLRICKTAILCRDPARFGLLYRLLWRTQKEPNLLQIAFDADVIKIRSMAQAVQRDLHKMKAFVRFNEVNIQQNDTFWSEFVAWFEPSHFIVQASASFFTGRFTNMRWSILTPDICMHWDGKILSYSPGAKKEDKPKPDAEDNMWRAYYSSIFNPARLKISAMQAQMPKKYWRNLPEAELIADLVANADKRKDAMIAAKPSEPQRKIVKYTAEKRDGQAELKVIGTNPALHRLNAEFLASKEFNLAEYSTQAVLGFGATPSNIMLIGDQPNEQEDLAGKLFMGPAGRLLDQALQEAGMVRSKIYVTNVLKHHNFKLQGTRRVQLVPSLGDINAYRPWLQREIEIVKPRLIIAMGAVAAQAITGKVTNIEATRGKLFLLTNGQQALVTYHPAFIMHTLDKTAKQLRYERLVTDLKLAAMVAISADKAAKNKSPAKRAFKSV